MRACAVCWPVRFGDPWEAVGGRACDRSCIGERAEPGRCRGEPHAGRARVGASVPNPVRAARPAPAGAKTQPDLRGPRRPRRT
ncbi:hypothetical protein,hypothetical protein [Burkholderia pseudomallei]|nr:hypothetical protein,hypothetical protein [Burkholderia pseudomallei]